MSDENLTTKLEKKGNELILDNQKLVKLTRTTVISLIIFFVLGLIAVVYPVIFPEQIQYEIEVRIIIAFFVGICLVVAIVAGIKSKKIRNRVSGLNLAILHAYQAYLSLTTFQDPAKYESKLKHFEKGVNEIDNLSYAVAIGWRDFVKFNEILPNLDSRMETFVNSLNGLKRALEKKTHEVVEIQVTLLELMEFLENGKKNDFVKINTELEKYNFVNPTISTGQRIKGFAENPKIQKHIIRIAIFLGVSAIPGIFITAFNEEWIIAGVTISGSFAAILIGAYLAPLLKKISESE